MIHWAFIPVIVVVSAALGYYISSLMAMSTIAGLKSELSKYRRNHYR